MALLRSYTDSGRFVPKPQRPSELLDQWRLGTDPNAYVFDLDKEKEVTPGMQRKARRLARENRKRRRAETLGLQLAGSVSVSREPSLMPMPMPMPSTQPAPETTTRFSQPRTQQPVATAAAYSQQQFAPMPMLHSDPMTMSQPVPGPFAQRPKKRPKRKGGF